MMNKTAKKIKFKSHRVQYLERMKQDTSKSYNIKELSKISGFSNKTLQTVYNRGVGASKTNILSVRIKGTFKKTKKSLPRSQRLSKEQWGMARVYAFLNKLTDEKKKLNHDTDLGFY